jgi:hypothetical protein
MPRLLTADEIMPLVASLSDSERVRLLRWIALPRGTDASAYSEDEPLAWDADGWEAFR